MPEEATCLKVAAAMPEHTKIVAVGGDAAWLWICILAYCKRSRTDGIIAESMIPRVSDRRQPMKLLTRLINERLMHGPGHKCEVCVQPLPGFYVAHEFPDWQGTVAAEAAAEEAEAATQEAKAAGGAYGNHRRWHVIRDSFDPACEFCAESQEGSEDLSVDRSHMRSVSDASTDGGTDRTSDESDPQLPLPPQTPPSPTGDITPPTPQAAAEPKAKPKRTRRQAYDYGSDKDFQRFWDVFPIKSGKPDAFKAWLAALARGADPEVIIAAAERYRDDPHRNPLKTKYPQGWINGERYNDEPVTAGTGNWSGRHYEF